LLRDLNHTIEVLEWKLRERVLENTQSLQASLQAMSHYIEGEVSTISKTIIRFSQRLDLFVLKIREKAVTLNGLERLLESLDHKAILKRGFSITYASDGRVIKNVCSLSSGDRIRTVLAEGSVESTVDGIQS
jgi:exodeoxyribonuclease VII large subunit